MKYRLTIKRVMKKISFIFVVFLVTTTHLKCSGFSKMLSVNLFLSYKNVNQNKIIKNHNIFKIFWKKSEKENSSRPYSNAENLDCKNADKLKLKITEYVAGESMRVYEDIFVSTLEENNKNFDKCYFPRSNEAILFWSFVEDSLVKNSKESPKAMKLLIDLCYLYRNNAEFSTELFGFSIIKAAINNPALFVKELAERSKSEIVLCINKLKYIDNLEDKVKIKKELNKIKGPEYQLVIKKIKEILSN